MCNDDEFEDKSYEVGYCKPPKEHQFKPGQSGNPKGRPKGPRTITDFADKILRQKYTITKNGCKQEIHMVEAILQKQIECALKGNIHAQNSIIRLMKDSFSLYEEPKNNYEDYMPPKEELEKMKRVKNILKDYIKNNPEDD